MLNLGYNNRWVRLIKDLVFVGLAVWLVTTRRPFAVFIALLAGYWYGRDAWFQAKALWQEKTYKAPESQQSRSSAQAQTGPTIVTETEDSKITVTNLSDAKEVEFTKD